VLPAFFIKNMAAYKQEITYYEDGYGAVKKTFVVAETHDELFTGPYSECNIFDVKDTEEGFESDSNVLQEDTLSFEMNEAAVVTDEDAGALSFVLDTYTDPAVFRYCGLFLDAASQGISVANKVFSGVILPDFKAEDLEWKDSEWGTAPTPVRRWDIKAQPFSEASFDECDFKEIVSTLIADTTWKNANIVNPDAYLETTNDTHLYITRYYKMVNLNSLLIKLTDIVEAMLTSKGLGTYTIEIDNTNIDGKFGPARWVPKKDTENRPWWLIDANTNRITRSDDNSIKTMQFGSVSSATSFYVSWQLIELDADGTDADKAQNDLWINNPKVKTFTDFLYLLAANFGMYLNMYFSDTSTIKIKFVNRGAVAGSQVYIKDVDKASLKLKSGIVKEKKNKWIGRAFYDLNFEKYKIDNIPSSGWEWSIINEYGIYTYEASYQKSGIIKDWGYHTGEAAPEGDSLLLTITPILRRYYRDYLGWMKYELRGLYGNPIVFSNTNYFIPHNILTYRDGALMSNMGLAITPDPHLGLYMGCDPMGDIDGEPATTYMAPVGLWQIKVNDTEYNINSISEYLNGGLVDFNKPFFDNEYELNVPFLMGFSPNSDGSTSHWNNLILGSTIIIDGNNYTVVKIKRNYKDKTTSITLHSSSRFNFQTTTPINIEINIPETTESEFVSDNVYDTKTTEGSGKTGNLLIMRSDGKVERMLPIEAHYNHFCGVALSDFVDNEQIQVQINGIVSLPSSYSLTYGDRLFLRDPGAGNDNWSNAYFDTYSVTEHYFFEFGNVIDTNKFKIEIKDSSLFEAP